MEDQFSGDVPVSQHREPTIFESNVLYFSVLIGMIIFGEITFYFFDLEKVGTLTFLGLLAVLMAVVIGLPMLVYIIIRNVDYKALFRLYPVKTEELILVAGLAILGYPAVTALNIIWHLLIRHIGTPIITAFPPITSLPEYLMAIIVIGIFPSVFEELMFRGIMLRGYERLGKLAAVVITGVMFSFLHMSFANLPALILLGIVLGYVVHRSNSVYAGMLYHFIHNSIAVTLIFLVSLAQRYMYKAALPSQQMNDEQMKFMSMIVWLILGALSAGGFVACLIAYNRKTKNKKIQHAVSVIMPKRLFVQMLPAIGGSIIIILLLVREVFAMIAAG